MWIKVIFPLLCMSVMSHAFHLEGMGMSGHMSSICRQAPPCCAGHVCRPYQRRGSSRPVAACALTPDSRPLYAPGSRAQRMICSAEASSPGGSGVRAPSVGGRGQTMVGQGQPGFGRPGLSLGRPPASAGLRSSGQMRWGGRDLAPQMTGGGMRGFPGFQGPRSSTGQGFPGSRPRMGLPGGFDASMRSLGERIPQAGIGQQGLEQLGLGQSNLGQTRFEQSRLGPSGFGQQSLGQPRLGQASFRQPGFGQPSFGQTRMGSSGFGQADIGQPGMGQPGMGGRSRSQPGFTPFPGDVRSPQLPGGQLNTFADVPQDQRPFVQGQSSFGNQQSFGSGPSFDSATSFGSRPSFNNGPALGSRPSFGSQPSFGSVSMPTQSQSFGRSLPGVAGGDTTQGSPRLGGQRSFDQGQRDMSMAGPSGPPGPGQGFGQMPGNILPPSGSMPQSFLAEQPPITATAIDGGQGQGQGQGSSVGQGSGQSMSVSQVGQSQDLGQRLGVDLGQGGPQP